MEWFLKDTNWLDNQHEAVQRKIAQCIDDGDIYSAFTTAELGEMLPVVLDTPDILDKYVGGFFLNCTKPYECGTDANYTPEEADMYLGKWIVSYSNMNGSISRGAETEADARAKMLIYLLENNLIKPEENT